MPDDVRQKREDEWFARHEEELLRQARRKHDAQISQLHERQRAGEDKRLKDLHWMKCPKCGHDMAALRIEGVEVDRCGTCEGIYLDNGELEAVLLKASGDRRGFFRRLMGL